MVFLADDADMLLCAWIIAIVVPGPSIANEVAINGSGRKKGLFQHVKRLSPRNKAHFKRAQDLVMIGANR